MQFYDSSGKTGIVDDVYYQTNSNTTTYPLGVMTSHINRGYGEIVATILKVDKLWRWDDRNISNQLETTFNLNEDQSGYGILASTPSYTYQDFNRIFGVSVKDANGEWKNLRFIVKEDVIKSGLAWDKYKDVSSTPEEYALTGTTMELKPAPNYDSTAGGKIYLQRNPIFFTSSDTTKVPGFDSKYHILLSYYGQMGYQACKNRAELQNLIDRGLQEIVDEYANRAGVTPTIGRKHKSYK